MVRPPSNHFENICWQQMFHASEDGSFSRSSCPFAACVVGFLAWVAVILISMICIWTSLSSYLVDKITDAGPEEIQPSKKKSSAVQAKKACKTIMNDFRKEPFII